MKIVESNEGVGNLRPSSIITHTLELILAIAAMKTKGGLTQLLPHPIGQDFAVPTPQGKIMVTPIS